MPPARRSPPGRRPGRPGAPRQSPKAAPRKKPEAATPTPAPAPAAAPAQPDNPALVPAPAARPIPPAVDRALVVAGTVVGILLSVATGFWEVFLSPLYWGRVPLPLAPVLAVLTTLGLIWFTRVVTGRTGLSLLPGVAWFIVMIAATMPRPNGSNLLPSVAWMGLVAVLAGSATWTIAAYRMIAKGSIAGGPITRKSSVR